MLHILHTHCDTRCSQPCHWLVDLSCICGVVNQLDWSRCFLVQVWPRLHCVSWESETPRTPPYLHLVTATSIFQLPPSRTTTSSQHARPSGILRRRSDGLECAAWPPRPVTQCRQFQEDVKDASVSECTLTLSALEALCNALYKFKTYLLTYLLTYFATCEMRCWSGGRGTLTTGLCATILCTNIMVHKGASSFYGSVDCIRQWLGDRDCTAQYNCCLPATTDCRRFCCFVFLFFLSFFLILYDAPAMSLTW